MSEITEAFKKDVYSRSFIALTYLGQWKIHSKSRFKRRLYSAFKFVVFLYSVHVVALGLIDLYNSRNDFKKAAYNLCSTSLTMGITLKNTHLGLLAGRLDKLRFGLFVDGRKLTEPEDMEIKKQALKNLYDYSKFFVVAAFTILPVWLFSSLASLKWEPRELPFPVYFPFDIYDDKVFFFGFFYHATGAMFIAAVVVYADLALFSIMFQILAQYEILAKNIIKIDEIMKMKNEGLHVIGKGNVKDNPTVYRQIRQLLKDSIQKQLELMSYVKELEYCYNKPMMIQLITGCVLSIGNGLELIVVSVNFSYKLIHQVGYTLIVLLDVFLICTLADLLIYRSQNIAKALYDLSWYDMDNVVKKDILLMTTGAQKVVPLTAGKMFKLNLSTFLGVLKNTYSWLALFRQVMIKK